MGGQDRTADVKMETAALAGVVQLIGRWSHKLKGHRLDSQSGHIPGLQVWSLVWAHTRGNPLIVSLPYQCSSPSFSPSLPRFLKSTSMSLGEDEYIYIKDGNGLWTVQAILNKFSDCILKFPVHTIKKHHSLT